MEFRSDGLAQLAGLCGRTPDVTDLGNSSRGTQMGQSDHRPLLPEMQTSVFGDATLRDATPAGDAISHLAATFDGGNSKSARASTVMH